MEKNELAIIWDKTNGHCHFCGERLIFDNYGKSKFIIGNWYIDHIFPKSKGGKNTKVNYLSICGECNRLKWHRTGKEIQKLVKYGIISVREKNKGSEMGKKIDKLYKFQEESNKKRRKISSKQ